MINNRNFLHQFARICKRLVKNIQVDVEIENSYDGWLKQHNGLCC